MADLNPLSFKGTSPEECEDFVATIRRRAFDQGKHRDNEWMAGFASGCFVRDAFYWYEELDEDVQNDWSRLRPALVARFGRGGSTSTTMSDLSSTSTSAPFPTIPTPAAAPPTVFSPPSVRKGHLKVLSLDGRLRGYLAKTLNAYGSYRELSGSVSDALLVSFPVSSADEAFEIQIINASQHQQTSDILAITWSHLPGNTWMDDKDYVAWACSFFMVTSAEKWAIERKVWKISNEGELSIEYPKPNGRTETLHCSAKSVLLHRSVPAECGRIIFENVV